MVVIGIILSVVLLRYTYYTAYILVGDIDGYGCTGCERSTANSNAKLVYTNIATYMTKCEVNNVIINDGIYCGSLSYSPQEETYYRNYYEYALLDGSEEDALNFMRSLMGSSRQGAGYFYIMVKDGLPLQSYWSKDEKLLYYKERLTSALESGSPEDISAFLSNIAADRSKNYFSIKIENGRASESRFSVSRRLLKGAECGGSYPTKNGE